MESVEPMSYPIQRPRGFVELLLLLTMVTFAEPLVAEETAASQLDDAVEAYYETLLELNPILATFNGDHRFDDRLLIDIAPAHRKKAFAHERRFLKTVQAIDPANLDTPDRLTRDIFLYQRKLILDGADFPDHLLPVDQLHSFPVLFAMFGAGGSIQPFKTVTDYENWLARVAIWPAWVDQAIVNMRLGMERGIVQPRAVVERILPQLESHLVADPTRSVFYRPVANMPSKINGKRRNQLQRRYRDAINKTILPGYQRLFEFMRDEYLPSSRDNFGMRRLPDGAAWYAQLVRAQTTTSLTPEEIHKIGMREVERVLQDLERERRRSWPNARPAWDGGLLDGYRSLTERVEKRIPQLFGHIPRAKFEVRPVEEFRRGSAAGGSYVAGTPDGARPGVFYVNATERATGIPSDALFLHEAVPGHHFQISLQRELDDLPRFRRFGQFTAYTEGWALYVEQLGEPLGLYQDRTQTLRALQSELFRARRLVVDTGLHAMGWTRRRAINFISSKREVDRYLAMPGQALTYKIGQLRITALRRHAEERLGADFDVKQFHDIILGAGALPLDILEKRVEIWIDDAEPKHK